MVLAPSLTLQCQSYHAISMYFMCQNCEILYNYADNYAAGECGIISENVYIELENVASNMLFVIKMGEHNVKI